MKKVGICGVYGNDVEILGGQTIKVKELTEELIHIFGTEEVTTVNTYKWRKNPLDLFIKCCNMIKDCENIIIMPAHNGLKVFSPMFFFLNILFKRKIHYIVIGGWLYDYLCKYKLVKLCLHKFSGIYVETKSMKKSLESLGFNNVHIMNNFKRLKLMNKTELTTTYVEPYKLCMFSRVTQGKGIEDAINSIVNINTKMGRVVFNLDIYGPIDNKYKDRFEEIIKISPQYIKYCGFVDSKKSVDVIKNYFVQLFPTRYKTEGIPGSIIDSYFAGVPVLASRWNNFNDVIDENKTGIGFEFLSQEDLEDKLIYIANNPKTIIDMKINCIDKSLIYSPDYVMKEFIEHLK